MGILLTALAVILLILSIGFLELAKIVLVPLFAIVVGYFIMNVILIMLDKISDDVRRWFSK